MAVFATLFHVTLDPARNPLPFTVSVKPFVPAAADVGDSDWIVGAGLFGGGVGFNPPQHDTSSKHPKKAGIDFQSPVARMIASQPETKLGTWYNPTGRNPQTEFAVS